MAISVRGHLLVIVVLLVLCVRPFFLVGVAGDTIILMLAVVCLLLVCVIIVDVRLFLVGVGICLVGVGFHVLVVARYLRYI